MDGELFLSLFKKHINIAKQLFIGLPNQREAMEWARDAVNEAIATHNPELGSLSTHVTYIAKKYRTNFIRSNKRWRGIQQDGKPVGNLCRAGYKRVATYSTLDDDYRGESIIILHQKHEVIAREYDLDFIIDLKDIIEHVRKERRMNGKMVIAVEDWINDVSDEITKTKLGCTRFYVQRCQRRFRRIIRRKLGLD